VSDTLGDEHWRSIPPARVALAFLGGEWDKWTALAMVGDRRIVDEADLSDFVQNSVRASLLANVRGSLLALIPRDTQWFEVQKLRSQHFGQLRAINFPEWNSPDDANELDKVAIRKPIPLRAPPSAWEAPILWGHDKAGPFTVLEGNHRMTALAACEEERSHCSVTVFVGLSVELCRWHLEDAPALRRQGWQL
jgi:hypothetical protein